MLHYIKPSLTLNSGDSALRAGCLRNRPSHIMYSMRLILPDRSERVIATATIPLDQLLLAEGINPLGVIATRDGALIPEDTPVRSDDVIRLIQIAHGG